MINLPLEKTVSSESESQGLAKAFSEILSTGEVVCLDGNLGSGKTYFVKAVCSAFGVDTVSSPSFAIVNEYRGSRKIIHVDFYRIKNGEELSDIGFEEYLSDGDSILFIEWANLFPEVLPRKCYHVEIRQAEEEKRIIKISRHE